ncbi:unnamed protein product [Heterobilharzia americana]|nr:unnamed protein product [Heterobilharzia americana]
MQSKLTDSFINRSQVNTVNAHDDPLCLITTSTCGISSSGGMPNISNMPPTMGSETLKDGGNWIGSYMQANKMMNNSSKEALLMHNPSFVEANLAAIAATVNRFPVSQSLPPVTSTSSALSSPSSSISPTVLSNDFTSKIFTSEMMNSTNSAINLLGTLSNHCENTEKNMKISRNQSNWSEKRKLRESLHDYAPNLSEAKRMKFQEQISGTGSTYYQKQDQNDAFWKLGQLFPHLPMLCSLWPGSLTSISGTNTNDPLLQKQTRQAIDFLEKNQSIFPIISLDNNNQMEIVNDVNCTTSRNRSKMNSSSLDNNNTTTSGGYNIWSSTTTSTAINKSSLRVYPSSSIPCSSTPNTKLDDCDEASDSMMIKSGSERNRNSSSDDTEENAIKPVDNNGNPSNDLTNNNNNGTNSLSCSTPEPQQNPIHVNGAVHNTLRKTRSDMKVIHRYLIQVKHDTREIHQIPSHELDRYIQDFVLTAKKKDGHEYEPESLKAFVHSLERHLKHHDYSHSVLKGNAFAGTRAVLNQRLNELRALSRSGVSTNGIFGSSITNNKRTSGSGDDLNLDNRSINYSRKNNSNTNTLTSADLLQAGILGTDNPQAILNSLWLMNRTQFNIGGTQRHRNLVWGQFQLVTDENGIKAIKFTPLFESAEVRYCRGYGGTRGGAANHDPLAKSQPLSCTGSAKRQPLPFNCVEMFEIYANLRPLEARGVSEPFYLCPDPSWEHGCNWFKTNAAGSQLLSRIPRLLGLKPSREPIQPSTLNSNIVNKMYAQNPITSQHKDPEKLTLDSSSQPIPNSSGYRDHHQTPSAYSYFSSGSHSNCNKDLVPSNLLNFFPFLFPPTATTYDSGTLSTNSLPTYRSLFNPSIPFPDITQSVNSSLFQPSFKNNHVDTGKQINNHDILQAKENNNHFPFSVQQVEQDFYRTNSLASKASPIQAEEDGQRDRGLAVEKVTKDGEEDGKLEKPNSNCFSSPPPSIEPDIENLSTSDNSPKLLTTMPTGVEEDSIHSPVSEHYASGSNISRHSPVSSSSSPSSSSPSTVTEHFNRRRHNHHYNPVRNRRQQEQPNEMEDINSSSSRMDNPHQHHERVSEFDHTPADYSNSLRKVSQQLISSRLTTSPSSLSSSVVSVTPSPKSHNLTHCKVERTSYV